MALGPIEIVVLGFPGNQFTGGIMPELERLVDSGVITVVDGLFITKDDDGDVVYLEFDQIDGGEDVAAVAGLIEGSDGLLSDEDVDDLADMLEPGSSAAALVFEHTWAKPFRDEVVASGGLLLADIRIPGAAVDLVLEELAALEA